jgi:hypothetical protein
MLVKRGAFLSLLAIAAIACGARTGLDSSNALDASATSGGGTVTGLLAISAGRSHTCALRSDGTVVCWGSDSVGQLGNGTSNDLTNDPVTVSNLTDAIAVTAGPDFTCAIRSGGTIVCWGSDTLGYLAPGPTHPSLVPATVDGVASATAVAAGLGSTCALISGGTVTCWSTLAGPVVPTAVPTLNGASAIGTSGDYTCGLLPGGTVSCLDGTRSTPGTTTRIPSVEGATAITVATAAPDEGSLPSSQSALGCAIVHGGGQGFADCWSEGYGGPPPTTTIVPGVRATAVSTSGPHTCALLEDTTVACWGSNEFGQLGDGTTNDSASPVPVANLSGVTAVATGWYHTCALLADGTGACWGNNQTRGADGGVTNATTPVTVEF